MREKYSYVIFIKVEQKLQLKASFWEDKENIIFPLGESPLSLRANLYRCLGWIQRTKNKATTGKTVWRSSITRPHYILPRLVAEPISRSFPQVGATRCVKRWIQYWRQSLPRCWQQIQHVTFDIVHSDTLWRTADSTLNQDCCGMWFLTKHENIAKISLLR